MGDKGRHSILLVDDETSNLMVLNSLLSAHYAIFTAKSGEEALGRASEDPPDLILLDIIMPGMDGFEVLRRLKESSETRDIPVIIITGLDNEFDEEKGLRLGAADYITKPFKPSIVLARVGTQIQLVRQIRMIERLGMVDPLTDIPNRRCFDDRIAVEWRRAVRERKPVSFMMMDVDRFKQYNDTWGHPQGDALLKVLAGIFTAAARRPGDLAARLGGEEFGILLPGTEGAAALKVAEEIRATVETARIPTVGKQIPTAVTISIGVVSAVPSVNDLIADFISRADQMLYRAKDEGRNRVVSAF